MRQLWVVILIFTAFVTALQSPVLAASGVFPQVSAQGQQQEEEIDPALKRMEQRRQKLWNKQRQQDLEKDTEKLLQLATELKKEVDKSNKDTLSVDVIRKAEEIEKLAKSVQKKMRGGY